LRLASQSASRRALLTQAGIPHHAVAAACDEETEKAKLKAQGVDARDLALGLAEAKARSVAPQYGGDLILGCDQTLARDDGRLFDKAPSLTVLAEQLAALSGRTHSLFSAMTIMCDDVVLWRHVEEARLTMRPLSPAFIKDYLRQEGDVLLSGVGGYRIEGRGVQLFERIEGDQFTIMGLPLLPLLAFLRTRGVAPE
jgi:septum formation protein